MALDKWDDLEWIVLSLNLLYDYMPTAEKWGALDWNMAVFYTDLITRKLENYRLIINPVGSPPYRPQDLSPMYVVHVVATVEERSK